MIKFLQLLVRHIPVLVLLVICSSGYGQQEPASTATVNDSVYNQESVEEQAEYPGGIEGLRDFLRKNVKYPADARRKRIQGKVYVEFVISTSGEVTKVKIKRGVHKSLNREAVRVVELMPVWKPAQKNGRLVKQRYVLPINFIIND